ncbi:hypothetical protein BESB_073850 [Besnoitia besnoiti]|uniref:Uncharacterized protein n=1 Tax=Besnoitia besnoiti TaxID=94643 RepID=A0A2A9MEY5_BESBE|nr:uncharacterized protein BESB_073850 [Besnoitia besnoiti]PFH34233.1 hypothetical protein BESB_073850 [Besnoitia besnoiti]
MSHLGLGVPPAGGAGDAPYVDFSPISDEGDPASHSPTFSSAAAPAGESFLSDSSFSAVPSPSPPALGAASTAGPSSVYTPQLKGSASLSFSPPSSLPLLGLPFSCSLAAPPPWQAPAASASSAPFLGASFPLASFPQLAPPAASTAPGPPAAAAFAPEAPPSVASDAAPLLGGSTASCLAALREQFGKQSRQAAGSPSTPQAERLAEACSRAAGDEEPFPEKSMRHQLRRLDNRQAAIEMLANFLQPYVASEAERLVAIFAEEAQRPSALPITRLSIFYLFHHLLHQPLASPSPPGSSFPPEVSGGEHEAALVAKLPPRRSKRLGDLGYYVFLIPLVQMLPQFPPQLVEKVLRCCCISAERGFYTPEALRHLLSFIPLASVSVASNLAEIHPLLPSFLHPSKLAKKPSLASAPLLHERGGAHGFCFSCRSLLQLPALRCLLKTPSVTKGIAYARSKLAELPFAAAPAADVPTLLLPPASSSTSFALSPPPAVLSTNLFAGLPAGQLTECSAALDRATRLTGQEFILLQSSLLDLAAILQCLHEDFVRLSGSITATTAALAEPAAASLPSPSARRARRPSSRERDRDAREKGKEEKRKTGGEPVVAGAEIKKPRSERQ